MVQKNRTPIKITIANELYDALDAVAGRLRKEIRSGRLPSRGRGKSWGAGTVASDILSTSLLRHPELIEEWFDGEVLDSLREAGNGSFDDIVQRFKEIAGPYNQDRVNANLERLAKIIESGADRVEGKDAGDDVPAKGRLVKPKKSKR